MKLLKGIKHLGGRLLSIMKEPKDYPNVHTTAYLASDARVTSPKYLFMEEKTSISSGAIIMNGANGRFIMK